MSLFDTTNIDLYVNGTAIFTVEHQPALGFVLSKIQILFAIKFIVIIKEILSNKLSSNLKCISFSKCGCWAILFAVLLLSLPHLFGEPEEKVSYRSALWDQDVFFIPTAVWCILEYRYFVRAPSIASC